MSRANGQEDVDDSPSVLTWDKSNLASKTEAFRAYSDSQDAYAPIYRAQGDYMYQTYYDIEPNKTVKTGFTNADYVAFRPEEQIPRMKKRLIKMCMDAYDKVGIVKNVIDLMGDFGSQGINIVHENKSIEDFYQQWFKKINGKERSERFLNNLYRTGNVFIYRSNAKITPAIERYMKSLGKEDLEIQFPDPKKNVIPWRYNFFNPLTVESKNGQLSLFLGQQMSYELTANSFFTNYNAAADIPQTILDTLPNDVRNLVKSGAKKIPIDPERLHIAYYKKDDWEMFASPMIYSVLDDIIMLQKMRLADKAALDGAISNIRLWTLGNLEYEILPTRNGINKLRNILAANTGGGTMDLVWGPELSFTESQSQVWRFLGSEKYVSVLNALFAGLGVPPTLTGLATNGGGMTNNYVSLKTMVERLQYGRDQLIKFWEKELEIVRKAMGFRKSAKIMFDQMSLADDASEKNLLIQLADRDIISNETLLERFKEIPSVEAVRLEREETARKKEKLPPKLGPFPGPISLNTTNQDGTPKQTVNEGNGRPKFKQDQLKRKQRVDTPRDGATPQTAPSPSVADMFVWVHDSYDSISELANRAYLEINAKANMRQLTKAQVAELESLKLDILTNIDIMQSVTPKGMHAILRASLRAPAMFTEHLKANKISTFDLSIDDYKKQVLGLYAEYALNGNT